MFDFESAAAMFVSERTMASASLTSTAAVLYSLHRPLNVNKHGGWKCATYSSEVLYKTTAVSLLTHALLLILI